MLVKWCYVISDALLPCALINCLCYNNKVLVLDVMIVVVAAAVIRCKHALESPSYSSVFSGNKMKIVVAGFCKTAHEYQIEYQI